MLIFILAVPYPYKAVERSDNTNKNWLNHVFVDSNALYRIVIRKYKATIRLAEQIINNINDCITAKTHSRYSL